MLAWCQSVWTRDTATSAKFPPVYMLLSVLGMPMLILSCQTYYWNNIFYISTNKWIFFDPQGNGQRICVFLGAAFVNRSVYILRLVFFFFFGEVGGLGVTLLAIGIHRTTERWNSKVFLIKGSQQTQQKVVFMYKLINLRGNLSVFWFHK